MIGSRHYGRSGHRPVDAEGKERPLRSTRLFFQEKGRSGRRKVFVAAFTIFRSGGECRAFTTSLSKVNLKNLGERRRGVFLRRCRARGRKKR